MDSKYFGFKLRETRKAMGLSSATLADLCHVNHGYIRQLESGLKFPSTQLLLAFCDILKTSPNYLYGYAEDNVDKEFLERLYQLTPDQKQTLLCLLDAYITHQQKKIKMRNEGSDIC